MIFSVCILIFICIFQAFPNNVYSDSPDLGHYAERLETSISQLKQKLGVQHEIYNELMQLYGKTNHSVRYEKRQASGCVENTSPVAFHARLTNDISPLGSLETITYNTVVTNLGNGYDEVTGLFQAPVDGVYEFIATIWSQGSYFLEAEMVLNGNDICFARATAYNQTIGTCVGIVKMIRGDRVWVRHYNGRGTYANGEGYPSFVGHRIVI